MHTGQVLVGSPRAVFIRPAPEGVEALRMQERLASD